MPSILFEDNHLIVAVKESGQLTDNDDSKDLSLLEELRHYVKVKYEKPGEVYLTPIHRLDRGVSGLVLFARTSKAAERLNQQFRDRTVKKTYLSLVDGNPPLTAHLEDYLVRDRGRRMTLVTTSKNPEGKKCVLDFVVKDSTSKGSLLKVVPITGRPHQIRVQLSSRGWPIVGDVKYGSIHHLEGKILLHAAELEFMHPTLRVAQHFTVEPPSHWENWL
jgi:23S rRNA pseudouridine1911/1915/1917 synthase